MGPEMADETLLVKKSETEEWGKVLSADVRKAQSLSCCTK